MTNRLLHRLSRIAAVAGMVAAGGLAQAAACSGISLGTASTNDVSFGGMASNGCVVSSINAQSGPNGNTNAFSSSFGGGWSLLGKVDSSLAFDALQPISGATLDLGFLQTSGDKGLWSLTSNKNVTLDLVFAMNAGGRTGSFLFDNLSLSKHSTTLGSWDIDWTNNGNRTPDYSNLTVFGRPAVVAAVPEPQTYAMFFAGLGVIVLLARKSRNR